MTSLPALAQDKFRFFRNMPKEEISSLLEFCTHQRAESGETLWKEGDEDNQVAFILKGRLGIKKMTEFSDRYIIVGTYGPGSVVGELCLLTDNVRSVSAEAITDVELLFLSNDRFEALIQTNPTLGLKLLKGLFKMTSKRLSKSYERIASIF
ncbi:cyclic nucleotide-binding domain-containing protein [Desulfuromonas acetoxidans]|uniref:Cyclic nucleotide-binding protein n=1 Tax=Desulfuromonas acetoxidans (strain DSM 684 / 11070) TaxID=281689 RepID=Q1K454_DESA6|nr:cyclic nucleotide-binding domain-containing protein [Desulfuromonas acetoxidans]EAT17249.1 cyclic nucleotide-binding protein [Desulfuromonas acetoxidans DSM 684]MBF0645897.1 cyclic nucleotide-binding domain-containing protein [Desulfuromonas acetoxidans]NVD24161.1 cyclic nucleotide-binding domain-containing protein [Desulfuromonas acetoxidans]NVE15066.1 cyclic nucleotide-binding domain-containing protein [Desulfuromonas acetoxidans]